MLVLVLLIGPPQWGGDCALVLCIGCFGNDGPVVVRSPLIVISPLGPGSHQTWGDCLLGILGFLLAWGALWFGATSVSSYHLGL